MVLYICAVRFLTLSLAWVSGGVGLMGWWWLFVMSGCFYFALLSFREEFLIQHILRRSGRQEMGWVV